MTTPTPPSAMEEAQKIHLGVCICGTAYADICPHVAIARALSERAFHGRTAEQWAEESRIEWLRANTAEAQLRVRERAYEEAEDARERTQATLDNVEHELDEAEQEVERLREALKEIANAKHAGEDDKVSVCCELAGIASQALLTRHPAPEANNG